MKSFEFICWLRMDNGKLVVCNSDDPGAFRVYKDGQQTHTEALEEDIKEPK